MKKNMNTFDDLMLWRTDTPLYLRPTKD